MWGGGGAGSGALSRRGVRDSVGIWGGWVGGFKGEGGWVGGCGGGWVVGGWAIRVSGWVVIRLVGWLGGWAEDCCKLATRESAPVGPYLSEAPVDPYLPEAPAPTPASHTNCAPTSHPPQLSFLAPLPWTPCPRASWHTAMAGWVTAWPSWMTGCGRQSGLRSCAGPSWTSARRRCRAA